MLHIGKEIQNVVREKTVQFRGYHVNCLVVAPMFIRFSNVLI